MSQGSFDPNKRRLCPDGACIGVLGDDGRCRACGRASDGRAPLSASAAEPEDLDPATDDSSDWRDVAGGETAGDDDVAAEPASAAAGANGFRPNRPLCADGSCVGVVGDDGRCSVCGRPQGG